MSRKLPASENEKGGFHGEAKEEDSAMASRFLRRDEDRTGRRCTAFGVSGRTYSWDRACKGGSVGDQKERRWSHPKKYREDISEIQHLTLSFVCSHYPARLIGHLEQVRGFSVSETMPGIYYVEGNMVPTQIILLDALSDEESLWLKSLTDHIAGDGDIDRLLESYEKHFTDPHYRTVMDIVVRANRRRFEEMKSKYLCDALVELFEDELNEKAEKRAEKLAEKRAEQLAEKRAEQLAEKKANQLATEMVKKRQETEYGNLIQTCRELGASKEVSVEQLVKRYKLEPKEAEALTEQYWD